MLRKSTKLPECESDRVVDWPAVENDNTGEIGEWKRLSPSGERGEWDEH